MGCINCEMTWADNSEKNMNISTNEEIVALVDKLTLEGKLFLASALNVSLAIDYLGEKERVEFSELILNFAQNKINSLAR